MDDTKPVLFRETQHWRDVWWVMVLVIGLAAFNWYLTILHALGRPVGNNPAPDWFALVLFIVFGIAFPIFFLRLRLTVEVLPDRVQVDYWPLARRAIPIGEIAAAEPLRYNSLLEFGGWGIRGWGGRVAYNVSGDRGVELLLRDGRRVLVGSRRPDELAGAIGRAMYAG